MTRSVFLSYSGDRHGVSQLATALRRHGMRPWRDADALPLGARTQAEIEAELSECRAAMIWLTRQTLASDYVTRIELPTVFAEHDRRGLEIIPVFVDWGPGADASAAVRLAVGREIGDHNGHQIVGSAPFESQCDLIAGAYARAALGRRSADSEQRVFRCATRTNAASGLTTADINLDWTAEYPSSGVLPDLATEQSLRGALARVADEVLGAAQGSGIDLHAKCHLHLGIALGHAFRRTAGVTPRLQVDSTWWSCEALGPDIVVDPLNLLSTHGPVGATRASVEVSVTQDVGPGVDQTISAAGTIYRTRTSLRPPSGPGQKVVTDSALANTWAEQIAEAIRAASRQPGVTDVDLYLAAPLQLAVLLGWRLNAVGRVHIQHWVGNVGPYQRVWSLPAS